MLVVGMRARNDPIFSSLALTACLSLTKLFLMNGGTKERKEEIRKSCTTKNDTPLEKYKQREGNYYQEVCNAQAQEKCFGILPAHRPSQETDYILVPVRQSFFRNYSSFGHTNWHRIIILSSS